MSDLRAISQMPRTRDRVLSELRAAEVEYWAFIKLASDCIAMDIRPLLVNTVTGTCERIGPSPVPHELTGMIHDAGIKMAQLRSELAGSR